jgi:NAD(P)H-flavin reductase/ferredoxin
MMAPYQISVEGSGIAFPCGADETVLDAAERAGYAIPYSCRKGVCSTCEADLVQGIARIGSDPENGPKAAVRLCRAIPKSDLTIAPVRIEKRQIFPRKRIVASVLKLHRSTQDVAVIQLRFPAGIRVKFRAGQYLRVILNGGYSRNFSMANAPHESDGAQLHIRHVPGGRFSELIWASLKIGDKLEVEAPFGEFFLRDDCDRPIVFLATGTGFAPIKAMIEDMIKRSIVRQARFYWGIRRRDDLYMPEILEKWRSKAPWLTCQPVLSQPDEDWTGRRGFVQEAVLQDFQNVQDLRDLSGWQVYACGNPSMVSAARAMLTTRAGLPAMHFHADPFVPSGGMATS